MNKRKNPISIKTLKIFENLTILFEIPSTKTANIS
jgi:hypothetical protein